MSFRALCFLSAAVLPALCNSYILGADMSQLPAFDCEGTCSPYRESLNDGTVDALSILQKHSVNTIRLRIWNDPSPSDAYCNLTGVLQMAKRIATLNAQSDDELLFHLDFHYSDWWSDPGTQTKPQAWATLTGDALNAAVYNYTEMVLKALIAQNTAPDIVQIGNEIDNGMLWAAAGDPCIDGGYIWCSGSEPDEKQNWATFASLVAQGCKAVRTNLPNTQIMIHTSFGNSIEDSNGIDWIVTWYDELANTYGVDFDMIGLSWYPGWAYPYSSMSYLSFLSTVTDAFPTKTLVIAETSYPFYAVDDPTWTGDYPFTEAGQLEFVQDLIALMMSGKVPNWIGVEWWGTEYYQSHDAVWSPLFDANATALPALLKGFQT